MDPFTIALATFGIQKLRGKSTNRALRDAALAGGIGQFAGMAGIGPFQSFGQASIPGMTASPVGGTANMTFGQQVAQVPQNISGGIKRLVGEKDVINKATGAVTKEGSGFLGMSPGAQLGLGLGAATLLEGEEPAPEMPAGTRPEDYAAAQEKADKQLEGILESYDYGTTNTPDDIYNYTNRANSMYAFSKGGIAEVRKFSQGGINYLPSKFDHDEKDYNNYVRAEGYVEDGTGNGDKDTDTILAQLADGEFVQERMQS